MNNLIAKSEINTPPVALEPPSSLIGAPVAEQKTDLKNTSKLDIAMPVSAPAVKPQHRKTISIKNYKPPEEKKIIQVMDVQENEAFTLVQMTDAWEAFAEKLKMQGKMSFYSLVKRNIPQKTDNPIPFLLDHLSQLPEYEELGSLLINYLRQTLKNGTITLQLGEREQTTLSAPLTIEDKFQLMAEKNPTLHALRKALYLKIKT